MTPFAMFVLICVTMYCRDVAPNQAKLFVDQKACTEYVGEILTTFREKARENNLTIVDARAFCMPISDGPLKGTKT